MEDYPSEQYLSPPSEINCDPDEIHSSPLMAICTDGNRCGCAIYIQGSVQLVADRKDSADPYKGLDIVIQRVVPDVIIVSSVQKRLIEFLEKRFQFNMLDISKRDTIRRETAEDLSVFLLVVVPNVWFSMAQSMQKLLDSEMVTSLGITNLEEKSLFITSKIQKSLDVCAIRAISAINFYTTHAFISDQLEQQEPTQPVTQATNESQALQSVRTVDTNKNPTNLMPILEIKYVDPGPVLSVDKFTLESLGVFRRLNKKNLEEEPIAEDQDVQTIPSLYEILNQCQSPVGKKQMRSIMMWPLQDINELRQRHDSVEFFMREENRVLRDQLMLQLKNIVPLAGLLIKLSHSIGSYTELATTYKTLWTYISVIDLIKSNPSHSLDIFNRIVDLDTPDLRSVTDTMIQIIDFEASKKEKRIQVSYGIDQFLDEKLEIVKNLPQYCEEIAILETAKYKDVLRKTCRVQYIPRIGFLNSVDYSSTSELVELRRNKEFNILLHTEKSVYFKTPKMEELDSRAGDIACDLIDQQEKVVINLQTEVLKQNETILKLTDLCGELDCLISFANVSMQRLYTRPEFLLSDDEMDIRQAYHPLHCIRSNIIPNDVHYFKENSQRKVKVMVITGPNSCGKTTYMKAACLVVYMAHIGCFVPATQARIPLIDALLTRIHSANSISTGLSSFATELHQINYALGRATERSMLVIDEFGKGTQSRDGFHLLKGLTTYFATRTQKSPYVMIATHFNRLIDHLQNYSELILYKTFKVSRDPLKGGVIYEFKMLEGVGESSLADQVAAKAGVPQRIIERARQVRGYITEGVPIKLRAPLGA